MAVHHWLNRPAEGAERVFHPRRNLGVNGAHDQSVRFHGAQAIRQHLLADAIQVPLQLVEPPGAIHQVAQDEKFPFAADEGNGGGHRAGGQFFFGTHKKPPWFQIECSTMLSTNIIIEYKGQKNKAVIKER